MSTIISMMKKGGAEKILVLSIVALFVTITLFSLASASWWDFIKAQITGKASQTQNFDLNVSVAGTPPNITLVEIRSTVYDPTEYSATAPYGITFVEFNFTVNDTDGVSNLNLTSAKANATYTNGSQVWISKNDSCVYSSSLTTQTARFNCTLNMWYFFPGGSGSSSVWNVSLFISDNSGTNATNTTANFTYSQVKALQIAPASFAFAALTPGDTNKTATNDPLILNNTANYHFNPGNISINATNLVGETSSAYSLYAANFTVGTATGQGADVECGNSTWSNFMNRSIYVNLTTSNSTLSYGNLSLGNGVAQSNLYICLTKVGSEISSQAYSTGGPNSQGSWRVKVQ